MKWVILNICVIFSLFFSLNLPVSASPEFQKATGWEITGQIGGPSQGVAIQDNYAYIGVGTRLVVLDISNPANPIKVGNTAALDDLVMDVAVGGTHAYVAAGEAGLQI